MGFLVTDKRKEQFKKSQQKKRQKLRDEGLLPLSDYVLENTKKIIMEVKEERGFDRIGDSIDYIVDVFSHVGK